MAVHTQSRQPCFPLLSHKWWWKTLYPSKMWLLLCWAGQVTRNSSLSNSKTFIFALMSIKTYFWGWRWTHHSLKTRWIRSDETLTCFFSASRTGGELPEGVVPHPNGTLDFGRPLSLSDGGTYKCVAKNDVGEGNAEVEISVTGRWQRCQRPALRLSRVTHGTKKKKKLISRLSTVQRVSHSPKSWRTCWWSSWVRWLGGCWSSCSSLSSPWPATISAGTKNWRRSWQRRGTFVEHGVWLKVPISYSFSEHYFSSPATVSHILLFKKCFWYLIKPTVCSLLQTPPPQF